jgi:hypothetical protein
MGRKSIKSPKYQPWLAWVLLIVLLAISAWCTRYWMSSNFGLYEDDLTFIPGAIESDFKGVLSMVSGYFSTLAEQGRPFMWSGVVLFSHLGWRLGGMQGMYFLGFTIWLINIFLFFVLLRRIHGDYVFVAIGALAYVVFSADTNQAFLFNAYGLQTAITFLLIGLHLYISQGKLRWMAYLFLILVMLTYETPFWLFLAAPLLTKANAGALKKKLLANSLLVAFIFFAIYLLRLAAGESRAASLGFPEMIFTPIKHMLIGPAVGLGAYFLRPFQVLRNLDLRLGVGLLLAIGVYFGLLFGVAHKREQSENRLLPIKKGWWADLTDDTRRELRILFAGLVMLILAYPLTVILRAYAISGRETRVHLAAVVGAALILASIFSLVFRAFKKKGLRIALLMFFSLVFGFNFAFGFLIQQDYKRAWSLQKNFWQSLLPLIQDVSDGTLVLVDHSGLERTLYIDANTWAVPRILPQMVDFPGTWEEVPKVFRLVPGWEETIIQLPGYFTLDGQVVVAFERRFGDFLQSNTIIISTTEGKFSRLRTVDILDEKIALKPPGEGRLESYERSPLHHLLLEE